MWIMTMEVRNSSVFPFLKILMVEIMIHEIRLSVKFVNIVNY
jgi:hypothetical protein